MEVAMRRFLFAILSLALMAVLASAQNAPDAQQQPTADPSTAQQTAPAQQPAPTNSATATNATPSTAPPRIAAGSVIPVQLAKSIDAKKAKTGDEVIAKVTMDMKNNSGDVLVAKDTKVIGHVTEAQARNKEQKESELGIAFDHAVTKTGEMQMPMSIQAVIAPPSMNSNNGNGGNDQSSAVAPSNTPSTMASSAGHNMSGGNTTPSPNANGADTMPSGGDNNVNARPQITAKTEGVIGFSDMRLAPAPTAAQGSLLSSQKNNVKLEDGTMMLLRVNQ
jgi:hypothetical protein